MIKAWHLFWAWVATALQAADDTVAIVGITTGTTRRIVEKEAVDIEASLESTRSVRIARRKAAAEALIAEFKAPKK